MERPSAEELAELLSWVEFLEPLSEEERDWLAQRLSCSNLEAGETFSVDPEEHDEQMVLVLRGQLQVYESNPSGKELTLAVLEGGASVGATGLVPRAPRELCVRGLEPSLLCYLEQEDLERLIPPAARERGDRHFGGLQDTHPIHSPADGHHDRGEQGVHDQGLREAAGRRRGAAEGPLHLRDGRGGPQARLGVAYSGTTGRRRLALGGSGGSTEPIGPGHRAKGRGRRRREGNVWVRGDVLPPVR
jgi:hypothetical protein